MNVIRLKGIQIKNDEFSCTGEQLIIILKAIEKTLTEYQWFVADLTTNDGYIPEKLRSQIEPLPVGSTKDLIQSLSNIDQFFSGIFIAVPNSVKVIGNRDEWNTEDMPDDDNFEALALEIHAFDTSYFEIFAKEDKILEEISGSFHCAIEVP
jgi:hypothetical protein